jgi:RNA polymerase sigma factor (sigma-70 family)
MDLERTADVLARFRRGDSRAAEELFARYVERLTRLARARLSPAIAARTDPEDLVMSAFRSFFVGATSGEFTLQRSGDLWRLLATITLRKLYRQARRHGASGRSTAKESRAEEFELLSREPSPDEAIVLADELQVILATLSPLGRQVMEMRLREEPLAMIAEATGRSERTVRRVLGEIRSVLTRRLERDADD